MAGEVAASLQYRTLWPYDYWSYQDRSGRSLSGTTLAGDRNFRSGPQQRPGYYDPRTGCPDRIRRRRCTLGATRVPGS